MKKLFAILLTLILTLSFAAMSEDAVVGVTHIPVDTDVQVYLGGHDGFANVRWTKTSIDEYTEGITLGIATDSGAKTGWTNWSHDYLYNPHVYAADTDRDGIMEILVSGDIASDDYYTYCLRHENGEIRQLPFANVERSSDYTGYTDYGYGMVTEIGYNTVTLGGSQDVLGTYFAKRTFFLQDGVFETVDDGLWHFDPDTSDPDLWEYRSLNPVQPIPVTFFGMDGDYYAGTLPPGKRVILTASDCKTTAYFLTEDGYEGYFTIEPNADGWGSLINGIPEEELFEFIPYAD